MPTITFIVSLLFVASTLHYSNAQNKTVSSGGEGLGVGGTISYSIGLVDFITAVGIGGATSQGVQHAYEISDVTSIEQATVDLAIDVYPNPTSGFISLRIKNVNTKQMSYWLLNTDGKLFVTHKLRDSETIISLKELRVGIYFLKVLNGNREVKTFRIIKNL